MDALMLSRLQFAATAAFHFIFVPLTLGLIILVAVMETMYVKTGKEMYKDMTKFWGKLFLINFAIGVVTGLTMEFQFGMNWAEYSKYVGDIFGAPLAIEATLAFFLESTFIGVWIFGWDKISKKAHLFAIWMVALGTNLSALWILLANGWMQHPVGYVINETAGRAELVDFGALVFQSYGWMKFLHTVTSGYVIAAFFVMGISAWHLMKKTNMEFFKKSFKYGANFGIAAAIAVFLIGDLHAAEVAKTQPTKLAAMEAIWETTEGAPLYLFLLPDTENETNSVEALPIPGLVSLLGYHDANATVKGLKEFPKDERPPVMLTFLSFRLMVMLGSLFIVLTVMAWWFSRKDTIADKTWFLKLMLYAIPLPYIAAQLGWIVAEVGRQPWIVYGLMKTSDAVSATVSAGQVWMSIVGFTLFYGILIVVDFYLLFKYARKGPETAARGV